MPTDNPTFSLTRFENSDGQFLRARVEFADGSGDGIEHRLGDEGVFIPSEIEAEVQETLEHQLLLRRVRKNL